MPKETSGEQDRPTREADYVFFSDGIAIDADSLVISAGFSEAPNADTSSIYFKFGETWAFHDVDTDFVVSVAFSDGLFFALGRNGLVKYGGEPGSAFSLAGIRGKVRQFSIEDASDRGRLSRIRSVGPEFIACGWRGQVYRVSRGRWERFETGIKEDKKTHILDIAGMFPSDIYAVGLNGLLLHHDGDKWEYLDSPTNSHLYSILYISAHEIYICGAEGGIYRGDRNAWTFVGEPRRRENMWSMACYRDALYLASGDKGLIKHDGTTVTDVDFGLGYQPYTHRLSAGGHKLWSIGSHDLLSFDGEGWERITCPDNE